MIAPVFDMPAGVSLVSGQYRRLEYVINTPYHKANEDGRFQYHFVDGFYVPDKSKSTSPLVELRQNESKRHVQQVIDRWSSVVGMFADVDQKVFVEVSAMLLITLLIQGFVKTTFEKTPDNSLLVTGEWQGNLVYIDIFFDEEESAGYEVILNVYKQKQPIITVSGTLEKIFTRLFGELPAWYGTLINGPVFETA